jgi:glyoxylase-like metal-dependent hydrolase (beta-lactamase superfamily II)
MSDRVRIHPLHCGGDMTDWAVFDPFDERAGTKVYNPYFMYVIRHPQATVLVDSGVHPDLVRDPVARLGEAAGTFEVLMEPSQELEPQLARIGLQPADIDVVIQSHLHFDHAGGLQWLTHADVLVQREELAWAYDPPVYQREIYVKADFDHGLRWKQLDGDHDVFGDGVVRVIATPGHTRGHQSVLVKLERRSVFLLCDGAYLLEKMRARLLPAVLWSPDAMIATWDRIEALERETGALLMTTHELDYETSVKEVYE